MVLMTKGKGTMFFAAFFAKANWLPCTKIDGTVTMVDIVMWH